MGRRDELWVRGTLREERRGEGEAIVRGEAIAARNGIVDASRLAALREACDAEIERLHAAITPLRGARIRGMVTASTDGIESTVTVTVDGVSIVSTPATVGPDCAALRQLLAPRTAARPPTGPLPIVWRNGSAAVLLHEAIGHAAEHGHRSVSWPSWLRVRDVAGNGRSADLLAGEPPVAFRRESFRHVPLKRMTTLVASHRRAPFKLPAERIEVHLIAAGAYEPLNETITIDVAVADLVNGEDVRRIPRFALHASRSAIADALEGAIGETIRYPGVICSREGQELFVASHAPVMITAEFG